jgi:hypothetical protein
MHAFFPLVAKVPCKTLTTCHFTITDFCALYFDMLERICLQRQRFDDKSVAQARLLRRIGLSIDRALKRAALARRLAYKCCQEGLDDCEGWELVESREQMCNSAHKIRQNSS